MLFTVSICTRNRAKSLARTLTSILAAGPVSCDWDLLITDNGSTDDTQEIVSSFIGRLPIQLQIETRPGVANARNTATMAVRGEYMICTDDDVIVGPNWLKAYIDAFEKFPQTDLFGGRILPVLQEPGPRWFRAASSRLTGLLAERNFGDVPFVLPIHNDYIPYGANFAVRTITQRMFPFDPRRGPGQQHFGEETTSFMSILKAGHQARWVPDAIVEHLISPERQTVEYINWWYEMLGKTLVWSGEEEAAGPLILGVPRWLWRRVVTREIDFRLARVFAKPETWVGKLVLRAQDRGRIKHYRSVNTLQPR